MLTLKWCQHFLTCQPSRVRYLHSLGSDIHSEDEFGHHNRDGGHRVACCALIRALHLSHGYGARGEGQELVDVLFGVLSRC